ncbi:uncharacterized protein DSM5745_00939 [Aspergillus mulundensis]|uniref:Aminoglycoside phosphotransferase domain-containing protein n=1 Tax=Aspergillus mulundensis TaxID=1810919 RepID=A0A3D8T4W6_9EURO|nr:Uncharacterized protein DSM5745_00939 [Aspergillus mulundensis]RDW93617.1 Uncharacterized protein DSM5745_00939 [Aspergillus mulundensis]
MSARLRTPKLCSSVFKPVPPRIRPRPWPSTTPPSRGIASKTILADCNPEPFYASSSQRWLWNEPSQLARRYVRFNLDALVQIAEEAAGQNAVCVNVTKLQEGNFNKVFLASMQDGREVVLKIPNPNAGMAHYTTASEVATMQYVREKLNIPVPKVLGYCSRASGSSLGAEYIVMERAPGVELARVWDQFKGREKVAIVKQVAAITCKLARARFQANGALYKREDVAAAESIAIDEHFAIGPTVGRSWFDDRRGEVDVHRGPWDSAESLMKALAHREVACLHKFDKFPQDTQQGIFNGPRGYHPTKEAKLSVLDDFLKVLPYIIPRVWKHTEIETETKISSGILWHNDLHAENIFVDETNPSKITSIIDWQAVPISPLFLTAHHPSLIEYDGPQLEGFTKPVLPSNLDTLNPEAKKAAKQLFLAQSLWLTYEIEVQRNAPQLLRVFRYRETLPGQILGLIGSIFDDGEPYVQSVLAEIAQGRTWKQTIADNAEEAGQQPSVADCPLQYSERELADQQKQLQKWSRDIERKAQVLDEIGAYTGWNGAVPLSDYEEVGGRLEAAKVRFLEREARDENEKKAWEAVWPFQDTPGCS